MHSIFSSLLPSFDLSEGALVILSCCSCSHPLWHFLIRLKFLKAKIDGQLWHWPTPPPKKASDYSTHQRGASRLQGKFAQISKKIKNKKSVSFSLEHVIWQFHVWQYALYDFKALVMWSSRIHMMLSKLGQQSQIWEDCPFKQLLFFLKPMHCNSPDSELDRESNQSWEMWIYKSSRGSSRNISVQCTSVAQPHRSKYKYAWQTNISPNQKWLLILCR